jgi:hypothetical protein
VELAQWLSILAAVLVWMAYWLWAVDWKKLWPVLARGAWVPCVLLGLIAATAWSRLAPGPCHYLGVLTVPNFWGQLGSVATLMALALFSGWLQGQLQYSPPEISIEPPPAPGHGHGHAHGHHHGHHGHGHH